VIATVAGYSGSTVENPSYEEVQAGNTMHTEAVEIGCDPAIVSYSQILDAYREMHDPTIHTDPQYRSAIFFPGSEEQELAQKSLADQTGRGQGNNPILTSIIPVGDLQDRR
jgi:methionine-S-sulfoxide reductase